MKIRSPNRKRRGFLLIAVLVVVLLASMVAVSLIFRVQADLAISSAGRASEQAWAAAWSGVQRAILLGQEGREDPDLWRNNPEVFRHQLVIDDGGEAWYFTVYCEPVEGETEVRFGMSDEASRLNLNVVDALALQKSLRWAPGFLHSLTGENLEALPDGEDPATEDVDMSVVPATPAATPAAASATETEAPLVEEPESESDPELETGGDEESTAAAPLPEGVLEYVRLPSRRWLATLEEILTLPGFTYGKLYGEDANRNFMLDPNEDDGEESFPPDDADGQLFLGDYPYVTVYSYELNRSENGVERIRVNSRATDWEADGLSQESVRFIHLFQASDILLDHPVELYGLKLMVPAEEASESGTTPTPARAPEPLPEADEEAGEEAPAESGEAEAEQPAEVEMVSPITLDELEVVLDRFTARSEERHHGRININTASARVLQALPGVDESKADEIIQARENLGAELKRSPVWLLKENLLDEAAFTRIVTRITTRSDQYRFQVIGYAVPTGRHRIFEVVIDVAPRFPRVLYVRDITKLGLPFALPTDNQETNDVQENVQVGSTGG